VQKLETAFTAQMKTLVATQQKKAQNFTPAPSVYEKRTAAPVEDAKTLRGGKKDVIVQIIVASADRMNICGAQMLVRIQALMRVRSKIEGRMKSLLIQMPRGSAARRSRTGFLKRPALLAAAPQADTRFCAWYVSQVSPHDVNPLVDQGCPRSVGRINTASALARQLGIDFSLLPLDSTHSLHGFGLYCSDANQTVARWMLPVENLDGEDV
jgi:hypothetical protein